MILQFPSERRERWQDVGAARANLDRVIRLLPILGTFAAMHRQQAMERLNEAERAYLEASGSRVNPHRVSPTGREP